MATIVSWPLEEMIISLVMNELLKPGPLPARRPPASRLRQFVICGAARLQGRRCRLEASRPCSSVQPASAGQVAERSISEPPHPHVEDQPKAGQGRDHR